MKKFFLMFLRKLVHFVAMLNPKLPPILERDLQKIQGKGYGVESVIVEARVALDFLSRHNIKTPIVLDVGANIGNYSEAIRSLAPEAKIFAFEPSSFARQILEKRFSDDNLVEVVPFALGRKNSREILWSDNPGSGLASLTRRRLDHYGIDLNESEIVEVCTLDSWVEAQNIYPNFIKLDVEGHELDVLLGGVKTLESVEVVQFEFGGCNIDTRTFFQDFWYFLSSFGFSIYRISEKEPLHISKYSELDECFRTTNYLAVKA